MRKFLLTYKMLVFEDIKNNKSDVQTRSCKKIGTKKKKYKTRQNRSNYNNSQLWNKEF